MSDEIEIGPAEGVVARMQLVLRFEPVLYALILRIILFDSRRKILYSFQEAFSDDRNGREDADLRFNGVLRDSKT